MGLVRVIDHGGYELALHESYSAQPYADIAIEDCSCIPISLDGARWLTYKTVHPRGCATRLLLA
jgi:hypothetical protein